MNFYIYPIIVSVKIHNTIYIKPYMAESLLSLRSMNIMYIKYYIKTSVYIYKTFYIYHIIVFVKIHKPYIYKAPIPNMDSLLNKTIQHKA